MSNLENVTTGPRHAGASTTSGNGTMIEMDSVKKEREEDNDSQTVTSIELSEHTREPAWRLVRRVIEVAVLSVVIAVVWGLFSLPTVFFFIKEETTMLPSEPQNTSNQSNGTTSVPPPNSSQLSALQVNITCSTDFYLDSDAGYCKPACGQWKPFPNDVVVASAVLIIMAAVVSIVCAILIVTISILKYRDMLKFPSILILYQSSNVALFLFVSLIGHMDTQTFLCPSRDAIESLSGSTPYCTLFGISHYYLLTQGVVIWAEHIASILLLTAFPFSAKKLQTSGRMRIIHIAIVVIALILPIGPVAATLGTGGFRPFYHPNTCIARNIDMRYYAFVLPLSIMSAVGVSMLVSLFWFVLRRGLLRKRLIRRGTLTADPRNPTVQTTALIKILLIFFCYSIVVILGLASLAALDQVRTQYSAEISKYFICESTGVSSDRVCERRYEALYNPLASSVALFLLGVLWAGMNLLYVLKLRIICSYFKSRKYPFSVCTS